MNILKSAVAFVSKLSKRERMIFYVTLGIIALGLIDRMLLSPILDKISNLSEAIKTKEGIVASRIHETGR